MLKRFVLCLAVLWGLAACQSLPSIQTLPSLNDALTLQVTDVSGSNSLLIIEPVGVNEWRFVQVDALGAPMARQTLQNGQWRADGFLPPNPKARVLFSAVYAFLGQKNHWPVPSGLDVDIQQGTAIGMSVLTWRGQSWQVLEVEND